jgi:Xaa-Pro aminopeptidase
MKESSRVTPLGAATRNYRRDLMNALMDGEGLDALALAGSDLFQFATNFWVDVATFERPILCVVPRNDVAFVVLNEISTHSWRFGVEERRLWVNEASFYAEHARLRKRLPLVSQWNELVADRLSQAGLRRARIGTDSPGSLAGAVQLMPNLLVQDMGTRLHEMRLVKHEEEVAIMRELCSLSDWTQERYRENFCPGRGVAELDASMTALTHEEAARRFSAGIFPQGNFQLFCWSLSGPESAAPHGRGFGNRVNTRIEKGHVIVNCVVPIFEGIVIENERTWIVGTPSKRQVQLFEAARAATEAGCDAAIVGRPVSSIDEAAQQEFERAGVGDLILHRTGHGLGLGGHDYPIDMSFNTSPMRERMAFSVEPGIYEFGVGGFRHDDTVIVGKSPQVLTTTPKDLKSQTIA